MARTPFSAVPLLVSPPDLLRAAPPEPVLVTPPEILPRTLFNDESRKSTPRTPASRNNSIGSKTSVSGGTGGNRYVAGHGPSIELPVIARASPSPECDNESPILFAEMPPLPPPMTRGRRRPKTTQKRPWSNFKVRETSLTTVRVRHKRTFAEEVVYNFLHKQHGEGLKDSGPAQPNDLVQLDSLEFSLPKPLNKQLPHTKSRGRLSVVGTQDNVVHIDGSRVSKAISRGSEVSAFLAMSTPSAEPTESVGFSLCRARQQEPPIPLQGKAEGSRRRRRQLCRRKVPLSKRIARHYDTVGANRARMFDAMPEGEREALKEGFARFDIDNSGFLDHGEVIACLREFGLNGTTPPEKREILRICCEATASDDDDSPAPTSSQNVAIDLFDLALTVVPRVREALVELRGDELLKQFFKYDLDGSGKLSRAEMKELARGMGLDPRMMESLPNANSDDEVDFETFQSMIIRGREQLQRVCRDREREVQKINGLSEQKFQDFREDLVGLHDIFVRYDVNRSAYLPKSELMFMMQESGLAPKNQHEKADLEAMFKAWGCSGDDKDGVGETVSFIDFLEIFRHVRNYWIDKRRKIISERFHRYDRDRSGNLSSMEISLLLSDLGLVPTNRKEQEQLAHLIESVDMDGSGFIDFAEFSNLSQRIDEKLKCFVYEAEVEFAMVLGFTEKQMRDFRWVFDSLDIDGSQKLDATEVKNGLMMMQRRITPEAFESIFRKLDHDGSGELDFCEFLSFMKMMRDGESIASDDVQKLPTKAKNLDTRVLRRVLEYFRLAKHYINSLTHDDLVGLFCEYFKVGPNTNLYDALDVRTIGELYEAAQSRDLVMQGMDK